LVEWENKPADQDLPSGKVDIQIRAAVHLKYFGYTPLEVLILLDQKVYKKFTAYINIDVKSKAYMATRWIRQYERLDSTNVELLETYRSKIPSDAVVDGEDLDGKVLNVAMPRGRIITHSSLVIPPVVKNQDLVDVILKSDNMLITTKAKVLMNARKDEMVKLRTLDSQKEIYGKVIDEKTVLVEMAR